MITCDVHHEDKARCTNAAVVEVLVRSAGQARDKVYRLCTDHRRVVKNVTRSTRIQNRGL